MAHHRRSASLTGLGYALPSILLVFGVLYYAMVYTGVISTWDWNGISPDHKFVGLGNYAKLVQDPVIWLALRNTLIYALVIPVTLGLGMVMAVMAASSLRGRSIAKVLVFVPVILSPAVMAPVFRSMYEPEGTVNSVLRFIGLGDLAHPWLADPNTALVSLMTINVWASTGMAFIFYTAALTAIDKEVIEAARLDGAGNWRLIGRVIVPLTRSTSSALIILNIIGLLKTFELPYLVTSAGPAHATEFLGTYLYEQSISNFKFGYAGAITVVLVVLALVLSIGQVRQYRKDMAF